MNEINNRFSMLTNCVEYATQTSSISKILRRVMCFNTKRPQHYVVSMPSNETNLIFQQYSFYTNRNCPYFVLLQHKYHLYLFRGHVNTLSIEYNTCPALSRIILKCTIIDTRNEVACMLCSSQKPRKSYWRF